MSRGIPLFVTEEQLHALIAPHLQRATFAKRLTELELRGFPRQDPIFGGRYWRAVQAWLDARAGIGRGNVLATDGDETWDEQPERRSRARSGEGRA